MADKPKTAAGYDHEQTDLARRTCLTLATRLGNLMDDLVVVGGLVPSLIVDPGEGVPAHIGTMDLDVGLQLAVLDDGHYRTLTQRLRDAEFEPDVNEKGNLTRQRWVMRETKGVTIDFLIPPATSNEKARVQNIENDFAAFITPGLDCAFRDKQRVSLAGHTLKQEKATRDIWVSGPGAYVVLKALACHGRSENKDAYDLYYVVRNYGSGIADVATKLRPLLDSNYATRAIQILRADFLDPEGLGPRRVGDFLGSPLDETIRADVVGYVSQLLELMAEE